MIPILRIFSKPLISDEVITSLFMNKNAPHQSTVRVGLGSEISAKDAEKRTIGAGDYHAK
jgi:hypothetical protein